MHRGVGLVASLLLLVGVSQDASAAAIEFNGTLSVQFNTLAPIVMTASGTAQVNPGLGGQITALTLPSGLFAGGTVVPLTDPNNPELVTLEASVSLGSGALGPIASGGPLTQGVAAMPGSLKICLLLAGCAHFLEVPLTQGAAAGVGIGGLITVNAYGIGTHVSLHGNPWTIGSAALTLFTTNDMIPGESKALAPTALQGFVHGPVSFSAAARTDGVVQLVTATAITTNLNAPTNINGLFSTLTLRFTTPEPGTFLLVGGGVLALAIQGRRQRRR